MKNWQHTPLPFFLLAQAYMSEDKEVPYWEADSSSTDQDISCLL